MITTKKGSRTGSSAPKVAADFTTSVNTIAKYNGFDFLSQRYAVVLTGLGFCAL